MNIYVASSWRNKHQPEVVESLRRIGHEVYDFRHPIAGDNGFHWSEIDPEWKAWTPAAYRLGLSHPIAAGGFAKDFDAMKAADCCVLVLPSGRSSHLEYGHMLGAGKPGCVYCPEPVEPELMYLLTGSAPGLFMATSLGELFVMVNGPLSRAVYQYRSGNQ